MSITLPSADLQIDRFYRLGDLARRQTSDYKDFQKRILSLTGIPSH